VPSPPGRDEVVNLLVDWGEVESAVADALQPDRDDEIEALRGWRAVSGALADAVCASWDGRAESAGAAIARARAAVAALATTTPSPFHVEVRIAEGFAHYALYPAQYICAADRFVEEIAPASVLCLGLRSIGSILAHVVASAIGRRGVVAETRSVRPRGDPFD